MRQVDTTDPRAHSHRLSLLNSPQARRALEIASTLRIHIAGMYYCKVGLEWNSGDRRQADYLHHIDIALSGRRLVLFGDEQLELEAGKAYFLPGNTPVGRRCLTPGRVIYMAFRCEWLPGVDPLLDWPERKPVCLGACPASEWDAWLKPGAIDANRLLQLRARMEQWLTRVVPSLDVLISQHLEIHARFENVYSLVEEKLGADLRIADLAKAHGTSLHAFTTAFSSATGLTPKEYLNRRLNLTALQLVAGTNLKIKEIAQRLRFSDEFYFSRFFQKLNSAPPSRYRASLHSAE